MVLGAVTGALVAASAVAGAVSSLSGSSSRRRRQRNIRNAHNNYNAQREAVYGQLSQETQELWNQNHAARLAFREALIGQERQDQAQAQRTQVLAAMAQAMPQGQAQQGRAGSARSAQQAGQEQAGQEQGLQQDVISAQASEQGRETFDQTQQTQMLQTLLPNFAQAGDLGTIAQGQDMQNRLALEQRLAQLNAQATNPWGDAMGLVSGLTGSGAMISSLFGGAGTGTGTGDAKALTKDAGRVVFPTAPTYPPQPYGGQGIYMTPMPY